jgi:hypothetical protein
MSISSRARDFVERHSDVYKMQNTIAEHDLFLYRNSALYEIFGTTIESCS